MIVLPLVFQFEFLLLVFLLNVMARTSKSMLNKSGESGHTLFIFYFFLDLREKAFNFSPLSRKLAVGLSYMAFIILGYIHFITNLLRVLS